MQILQTHQFKKRIKKLSPSMKSILDEAVLSIKQEPTIGKRQAGDLQDVLIYKLPLSKEQVLLAYTAKQDRLTLLTLGRIKS